MNTGDIMELDFSLKTREIIVHGLNGKYFDACVIGGGIAGAGIFNLLSANGISTLLVDKGDFASGTSSYSSKLIHGGIRYLQQGHILLTRELLRERNYLVKNTNFVEEKEFNILIDNYSWNPMTIRFGLFLYEIIGGKLRIPKMYRDKYSYKGFKGYFTYTDAVSDDAYLTISNIVSGAMNGSKAINYAEVTEINDKEANQVEVKILDKVSGTSGKAICKIVINATGPWVNETLKMYTGKKISNLKLSKGSHVIVENKGYIKNPIAFKSHIDGRQMFIIPRDETLIIGTTDKFVDSPNEFSIDDEDRDYIFRSAKRIIPDLKEEDILRGYAGIRPLYGRGNSPGRVTRDFHIEIDRRMVSIMGVKITNYRNAARHSAKYIERLLGRKIYTKGLPQILYQRNSPGTIETLLDQVIRYEMPLYTEDIIKRRLGLFFFKKDGGESLKSLIDEKLREYRSK